MPLAFPPDEKPPPPPPRSRLKQDSPPKEIPIKPPGNNYSTCAIRPTLEPRLPPTLLPSIAPGNQLAHPAGVMLPDTFSAPPPIPSRLYRLNASEVSPTKLPPQTSAFASDRPTQGPTQPVLPHRGRFSERPPNRLPPPPPIEYITLSAVQNPIELKTQSPPENLAVRRAKTHRQQSDLAAMTRKEHKRVGPVVRETVKRQLLPDPYFKVDTVLSLSEVNFDEFVRSHEKTLVMFFQSLKPESLRPARHFAMASLRAHKQKHAFAAVDCNADEELCCRENAKELPMIKLYSNGFTVSSLNFLKDFTADQMNMLMIMAPVLTQPRGCP
ncbi:hypothetical protein BsWGS_16968 [Bradybaena similaris]